jgi:xanthine dehydrogenase accessory factor
LQDAVGRHLLSLGGSGIVAPAFSHAHGCHLLRTSEAVWLVEPNLPMQAHLFLFGAGHVGRAVIKALAALPCHITWVDERADMFPSVVPPNVRVEASDNPLSLLSLAKPGSCFLVMTHSHQLDMQLTEAILRLPHLGWFGLIGSETKRQLFVNRLLQRGLSEAQIEQMVCPVGIPGIKAKQPEVIAASIAAQLLLVWQERDLLPN